MDQWQPSLVKKTHKIQPPIKVQLLNCTSSRLWIWSTARFRTGTCWPEGIWMLIRIWFYATYVLFLEAYIICSWVDLLILLLYRQCFILLTFEPLDPPQAHGPGRLLQELRRQARLDVRVRNWGESKVSRVMFFNQGLLIGTSALACSYV